MPDLIQSLKDRDLGHLRVVAQLWGVELTAKDSKQASQQLREALHDEALVKEIVEVMPHDVRAALDALVAEDGRIPWVEFVRRFGEVREIGPGRRDRDAPHLSPISAAEALYYRALLARAFFDTPDGPQEFAYLPDDLIPFLKGLEETFDLWIGQADQVGVEPLGRAAKPLERACTRIGDDRILDDCTTLLAALRLNVEYQPLIIPTEILLELLTAAGLISASQPQPEPIKDFLEMPRKEAMRMLIKTWLSAQDFNELRQLPELVCEGAWKNSPLTARHALLAFISRLPKDKWWSLPAFIAAVKKHHPDFQRPAGDYDSWFIKGAADGKFLRGFENWDSIDGALIHYFITRVLFWLGLVDIACTEEGGPYTAFRVVSREKRATSNEKGRITVSSGGRIVVPRLVPRAVRYQVARFCVWEGIIRCEYRYSVTPASLRRAHQQHLKSGQLLALLQKNTTAQLPPPFVQALKRWEIHGTEARLENPTVLRVGRPEILEALRKSKANRFLGELLGPTTVIVKKGASGKVQQALTELGLLTEECGDSL